MKKSIIILLAIFFQLGLYAQLETNFHTTSFYTTSQEPKVKVFPNPATNVVNVLGLKNSPKAVITISDAYGNVLLQHQWEIKNHAINIPVSNLNPGIYTIAIISEEQQVRARFYKQ